MRRGPKPRAAHLKKFKPMCFRLSHMTLSKLRRSVESKAAANVTNAIEQAVEKWEF